MFRNYLVVIYFYVELWIGLVLERDWSDRGSDKNKLWLWNFYFFETRNLFWFLVFLKFLDFSIYNFKILKLQDSRGLEKILISQNLKLSRLISEISIFEGISKIIFNLLNSLIRQIFKLPYKLQRHVVRPNLIMS